MSIAINRIGSDITTQYEQEPVSETTAEKLCARLARAIARCADNGESGLRVLERIVGMAEHDAELGPDSYDLDLDVVENVLDEHRWAYDGGLAR